MLFVLVLLNDVREISAVLFTLHDQRQRADIFSDFEFCGITPTPDNSLTVQRVSSMFIDTDL